MSYVANPNILKSEAVKLRIAKGDITQADVDMLQKSYRIMTGSMVAGLLSGIPVWFITGRRGMPPMLRLFASSATSLGGSFLATSVGGAVAAIEIKKNMPEWERKMKVFQEITFDIQRAMVEQSQGIKPGTVIAHEAGVPAPDKEWTPPADQAPALDVDTFERQPSAVNQALKENGDNAWDRLRAGSSNSSRPPAPRRDGAGAGAGSSGNSTEAEYARRQKEFDDMLDRERKGGNDADTWK